MLTIKRYVVAACLLAAPLATSLGGAYAAPATPESLENVLQNEHVPQMLEDVITQLEAQQKQEIATETDPDLLQKKQAMQQDLSVFLHEELGWKKLQPTMIKTYQEYFSEEDAQALLAYYVTPGGKLYTEKFKPLAFKIAMEMGANIQPKMLAVLSMADGSQPLPKKQPKAWKPGTAQEKLALSLLQVTLKPPYETRMSHVQETMATAMQTVWGKNFAKNKARLGQALRQQFDFDAFMAPMYVKTLVAGLSEEEMRTLLESESQPARKRQVAAIEIAEQHMQESMQIWMHTEFVPKLLAKMTALRESLETSPSTPQ